MTTTTPPDTPTPDREAIDAERIHRFNISSNALAKQQRLTTHMEPWGPAPSWFDHKERTIHFNKAELFEDNLHRAAQLRALLYHEVSHVRYTGNVQDRVDRCNASKNPAFYAQVSNIIEDGRIEARMAQDAPGTKPFFDFLLAQYFSEEKTLDAEAHDMGFMADLCRRVRTGTYVTDKARAVFAPFEADLEAALVSKKADAVWELSTRITDALARENPAPVNLSGCPCHGEDAASDAELAPDVRATASPEPEADEEGEEEEGEDDASTGDDEESTEDAQEDTQGEGEEAWEDDTGSEEESEEDAREDADKAEDEGGDQDAAGDAQDAPEETLEKGGEEPQTELEEAFNAIVADVEREEAILAERASRKLQASSLHPDAEEEVLTRQISQSVDSILADARRKKTLASKRGRISSGRIQGVLTRGHYASTPQNTPAFEFETYLMLDVSGSMASFASYDATGEHTSRYWYAARAVRAIKGGLTRARLPSRTILWADKPVEVHDLDALVSAERRHGMDYKAALPDPENDPGWGNEEPAALEFVEAQEAVLKRRLVLFITDGQACGRGPRARQVKERIQAQHPGTYVVGLGVEMEDEEELPIFTDEFHLCKARDLGKVMDRVLRRFAAKY